MAEDGDVDTGTDHKRPVHRSWLSAEAYMELGVAKNRLSDKAVRLIEAERPMAGLGEGGCGVMARLGSRAE
jgi:hypothetical protein